MVDDDRLRESLLGRLRTGRAPEPPEIETPEQQDRRLRVLMIKLIFLVFLIAVPFLGGIVAWPWLFPGRALPAGLVLEFAQYAIVIVFLSPWLTKGSPFAVTRETLRQDIGVALLVMLMCVVLAFAFLLLGSVAR